MAVVQAPDDDGARYRSHLVTLAEGAAPHRVTWSDAGEGEPVLLPAGGTLFVSRRPVRGEAGGQGDGPAEPAVWLLPEHGEPRVHARRPGGLTSPRVSGAGVVVLGSRLLRAGEADDEQRRDVRRRRKVTAVLHDGMPIRAWDHTVGDESTRLLLLGDDGAVVADLAPDATTELLETSVSASPDAGVVAVEWRIRRPHGRVLCTVAVVDVTTRERRVVAGEDGAPCGSPVLAPDGLRVAVLRSTDASFEEPPVTTLVVVPLDGGPAADCDLGDLHPQDWAWTVDGTALLVSGDLHGSGAVVVVDPSSGSVTRTLVAGSVLTHLRPVEDGRVLALRSTVDRPPHPVAVATDGTVTELPDPAPVPALPGTLEELWVDTDDGERVHAWLVLPHGAGADTPAPVMLWVHGGPFGSFDTWSWRWSPWVAAAHGWAVVLPDPAHSTGYGHRWFRRGWPYEARTVFGDCEAVLEAVLARPETDGSRVACLGASFGGYLTNWVAGHVHRFGAIVTHAGLWALDQQHATTDGARYKTDVFGAVEEHPRWYADNDPRRAADDVRTPMLIVHGDRDFCVPVSEALRLWWDLVSRWDAEPATMPHRFLHLPDENHWVLSPPGAEVWWDAVLGFCGEHVLGRAWRPTPLL